MKQYGNLSGNAGVQGYDCGPRWIDVWFAGEREAYRYAADKVGARHVAEMKRLAEVGKGLTTYISTHPMVRDRYERPVRGRGR